MRCPVCGAPETRVIETRSSDDGRVNRRRRECPECLNRFTTYERLEEKKYLWVVKKDGSREAFDRERLCETRHALDQYVALREQGDEELLEKSLLADDHILHLGQQLPRDQRLVLHFYLKFLETCVHMVLPH